MVPSGDIGLEAEVIACREALLYLDPIKWISYCRMSLLNLIPRYY